MVNASERTWKEDTFAEFVVISQYLPRRTKESHNISHDIRLSVRNFNVEPPEYDARVTTFRDSERVKFQFA